MILNEVIISHGTRYRLVSGPLSKLQLDLLGPTCVEVVWDCSSDHFHLLIHCSFRIVLVVKIRPVNAFRGEKSVDEFRPMSDILFSRIL